MLIYVDIDLDPHMVDDPTVLSPESDDVFLPEEVDAPELGVVQVTEDPPTYRRGVDGQHRLIGTVGEVQVHLTGAHRGS